MSIRPPEPVQCPCTMVAWKACDAREAMMGVRDLFDITGRTALVTGGSRGLGLQVAEALAEMGAQVALLARKRDELDGAVEHLTGRFGGKTIGEVCDVMETASIAPALERV